MEHDYWTPNLYLNFSIKKYDYLASHSWDIIGLFCILWVWLGVLINYQISRLSNLSFLRYCELTILGTLGMPDCTHQNDSINLLKPLMFTWCMQKINFIPNFFLEILQKDSEKLKMIVSTCKKNWCLLTCKNPTWPLFSSVSI